MAALCSSTRQILQSGRLQRQIIAVPHVPTQVPRVSCVQQAMVEGQRCSQVQHWAIKATDRRSRIAANVAAGGVATDDVLVEEVMNPKPVLLQENMSIKDAVHTMLDANVAGAPVVNQTGQIVGVLTEADVIWKGAGKPEDHFIIPPVYIGALDAYMFLRDNKAFEEETHKILARTVKEAMVGKDKVVTVKPAMPMSDAAQLMLHHDVNLLPVVEGDGTVVGIVTRHDILRGIYASKNPLL